MKRKLKHLAGPLLWLVYTYVIIRFLILEALLEEPFQWISILTVLILWILLVILNRVFNWWREQDKILKKTSFLTVILVLLTNWLWLNNIIIWLTDWKNNMFDYNVPLLLIWIFFLYFIVLQIQIIIYKGIENEKTALLTFIWSLVFMDILFLI